VRFRYLADGSGEAVLRYSVSGGGEQDTVEQRLPVRIPTQMEAVAIAGESKDLAREQLSTPSGVRPDVGGLEVTMASTVLGGYGEAMRQLVDYPYGCLEQLSSRLVPFVASASCTASSNCRGARTAPGPGWGKTPSPAGARAIRTR
jgi:uncharacterized protein YfaS (alpha-2-macroglobulin family)